MKKYRVTIPEVWERTYVVTAEDEQAAFEAASADRQEHRHEVMFVFSNYEDDECWLIEEV